MPAAPEELETAVESKPIVKWSALEPLALVLLSLATVGTAWCSYQATVWGGAAQGMSNLSAACARRAAANELQAQQVALLDVLLFSQYVNARAGSNEALATFYADRFRDEAKTAFQAWIATDPFKNSAAPPHPFVTNFYRPRLVDEAHKAEAEAQKYWQSAGENGRNSRSYVLITVLLASALFCGGTAPKFDKLWVRRAVLGLGVSVFVFAVGRVYLLPVQL